MVLPIEEVMLFSKGGRVLWSRRVGVGSNLKKRGEEAINSLIGSVLLEEKGGAERRATMEGFAVEWRLVNEVDAVLVVSYAQSMEVRVGGELLERLRSAVLRSAENKSLDKAYDAIARDVEAKQGASSTKTAKEEEEEEEEDEPGDEAEVPTTSTSSGLEKLRRRRGRGGGRGKASSSSSSRGGGGRGEDSSTSKKKQPKVWRDAPRQRVSAADVAELDHSSSSFSKGVAEEDSSYAKTYLPEAGEAAAWEEDESAAYLEEDDRGGSGWLGSLVARATTGKTLTEADIEPIMAQLRERLISKNTAAEIAGEICESVSRSLVGTKLDRFGRVRPAVGAALAKAVERVLTPKKSTDVLGEALAARKRPRPYVIVFVGINGVGKSTTLSKVAYYLKSHGLSVGIAACDTFRSGAVEQLRSHARCLGVDLFERGYLKDPADVAKAAVDDAAKAGRDCVLVDTAGRMQNNEKLMRELAKLVAVNKPDLVLFVGEALVGSDGVSQISMFNRALVNYAQDEAACIDGIILTKFDCIDDKVGAALSVTYKTGQPIVFVGVGQKYIHLKKLSVNHVLNSLFH